VTLIAIALAVILLRRRQEPPAPSSTLPPPPPPTPPAPPAPPSTLVPTTPSASAPAPWSEPTPPQPEPTDAAPADGAEPGDPESSGEAHAGGTASPTDPTLPGPVFPAPGSAPVNRPDPTQPLPLSPIALAADPTIGAPPPSRAAGTDAEDNRVALLITRITGWLVILGAAAVAVGLLATIRLGILELRWSFLLWPLALAAFVAACVTVIRSRSIGAISASLGVLVLVWSLGALATRFDGDTGTRTVVVSEGSQLASRYHLAAGWLTVDLSALSIDEPTHVEIENRAGRVDVVVPDDAAVEVNSDVWAGRSEVLGSVVDGWRVDDDVRDIPPGARPILTIDLDVGIGEARLCRASDAGADHRCNT